MLGALGDGALVEREPAHALEPCLGVQSAERGAQMRHAPRHPLVHQRALVGARAERIGGVLAGQIAHDRGRLPQPKLALFQEGDAPVRVLVQVRILPLLTRAQVDEVIRQRDLVGGRKGDDAVRVTGHGVHVQNRCHEGSLREDRVMGTNSAC